MNNKNRRIFVLIEKEGQGIAPITFELLGGAKQIAAEMKAILCAAIVGHRITEVSNTIANFVDEVYSMDHPFLISFKPELYVSALEQLFKNVNPDAILLGWSIDNLDLAPRLAYRMGVQVITDCIKLMVEPETGNLLCTKPVYGAKVIAIFKLIEKPYIVTLRAKAIKPVEMHAKRGEIISFDPIIDGSLVKVEVIETVAEETVNLNRAEVIVAGGRGVKNAEGVEQLKGLINVLKKYFGKVELGASRPLVDAHLVPSFRQIGLTGEKVAPELYIAIGISGSLQHVTGILGTKKIVAINADPKANIFKIADYGVIGNFEEVLPAFKRRLEEL